MKKILVCIPDFKQGGIPRCLQSLLMNIDVAEYSVDLMCLYQKGPYKGAMPNCRVLKEDYVVSRLMVHTKKIKNCLFFIPTLGLKVLRSIVLKFFKKDILFMRLHRLGKNAGEYDVAIAYAEGLPTKVIENVKARKKLVWIHNDYAFDGASGGGKLTDFSKFDVICCVSHATELSFQNAYPQFRDKTTTLYNVVNEDFIKQKANEPIDDIRFNNDIFTIVSVGRVCAQKAFGVIPGIASSLKKRGVKFNWYIVGGGPADEFATVVAKINNEEVGDVVIMLGEKDNPYPFIKKSDLYVLTSVYESYPTVLNEARVLNVPIVSNSIPPAYEMLSDGGAVIIPVDEMAGRIEELVKDKALYDSLKSHVFVNRNNEAMNGFYDLLN
ncbi:MAG: glycosyltransferase [Candidatus Cryptobacteroides sp.]